MAQPNSFKQKSHPFGWLFCLIFVELPTFNIGNPLTVVVQVFTKHIESRGGWGAGLSAQFHVHLVQPAAALFVVAAGAGRHQIFPNMGPAQATGDHMIDGWVLRSLTTVLAGIVVPPKDLVLV